MNRKTRFVAWILCFVLFALGRGPVWGFLPPQDEQLGVRVAIEAPEQIENLAARHEFTVTVENKNEFAVAGNLRVWVVDQWILIFADEYGRWQSAQERNVSINGGETKRFSFFLRAGIPTWNAHYPIHALLEFKNPKGTGSIQVHPIHIFVVKAKTTPQEKVWTPQSLASGLTSLYELAGRVGYQMNSAPSAVFMPMGWEGSDATSGANFVRRRVSRGSEKASLNIHPPYKGGWGGVWIDYLLDLPGDKGASLRFDLAIRDHTDSEPASDGVRFTVQVAEWGKETPPEDDDALTFENVFSSFTKSKTWEPGVADLSAWSGQRIVLRLLADPGPANNTVCDSGYWGAPLLTIGGAGQSPIEHDPAQFKERFLKFLASGAERLDEPGLTARRIRFGHPSIVFDFSFAPGPHGLADGLMAIAGTELSWDGGSDDALIIEGMDIELDETPLTEFPLTAAATCRDGGKDNKIRTFEIEIPMELAGGNRPVQRIRINDASVAVEIETVMVPGDRDRAGRPRFTKILFGPMRFADDKAALTKGDLPLARLKRFLGGFGNVIEEPGKFDLSGDGFRLSTHHVGLEFPGGLSLVQKASVFPDRFVCDPDRGVYSIQTHHDGSLTLAPSLGSAFGPVFRLRHAQNKFQQSPVIEPLLGKMCLDYWGTDYQHGIRTVETLARYGVTDCVFVWHNWQRWGYDYRLPEIYPARGDHEQFLRLARTCDRLGILFCPHDNYIDFYPDAEGFSYKHIIFNPDGTPQRAWFNEGRQAQSYRWLPHAFFPWMETNMAMIKKDIRPTAYFTDVFTAIAPMDYYDSEGNFYPKTETIRHWSRAFDVMREELGDAPQISEAGHTTQLGHVAAGQPDHLSVHFNRDGGDSTWQWAAPAKDAERIPWHDAMTHGEFILFAGGLANRYVGPQDRREHGYGSDDYLSLTVLGGRNPMAHGDASAATVRTYWMLHDVCDALGRRAMKSHTFGPGGPDGHQAFADIQRQCVKFNDGKNPMDWWTVWVNRGETPWEVRGHVLPQYGFWVDGPDSAPEAAVELIDGKRAGWARGADGSRFVDARPGDGGGMVDFGSIKTDGAFYIREQDNGVRIILLPDCPASTILLRPMSADVWGRVHAMHPDGSAGDAVEWRLSSTGWLEWETRPGDFGFIIQ